MTKKILLVEHDASTCIMLQQQLSQHGYSVVFAPSGGDEGILLAVTEAPDLILVATDLPVIDGWQVIKILKTSTVTQNIPIIALMTLTSNAKWNRAPGSGFDDYELKPVDLNSILNKIKALISSAAVDSSAVNTSIEPKKILSQRCSSISQSSRELQAVKTLSEMTNTTSPSISGETMVVYVDDSPADSQAMAEIVRNAGYGYDNVNKPLDVIPTLMELRPSLIFLDLVMPFTNGYELCAQIRRTATFKKTPIIIGTNNCGIIDQVRSRFVGASGFFSKPVEEESVLKVLKKYLQPIHDNSIPGKLLI